MDNHEVKRRELYEPQNVRKYNPTWPLLLFYGVVMTAFSIIFMVLKRTIMSFIKEKKSIKGKVVLITGAGRGLGRSLALEMSKLGAHIACVDINTKNNEETVQLIKKEGGIAESFTCNIAKSKKLDETKEDVVTKLGPVDILINNAALVMPFKFQDITYDDIRVMYEVNVMGTIFMTNAFLPDMIKRNRGQIVTVSTLGAYSCIPHMSLYASTKSAVSRFFDIVRVELNLNPNNKIIVTTVHPYFINTSADYNEWFDTLFPILEVDKSIKSILDDILYEKDSTIYPSVLSITRILDSLFGSYQYNIIMKYFGSHVKPPSNQDRDQLPYSSILEDTVNNR